MPLTGRGMLVTSMDIDEADEPEFNRWYDREHLAEQQSGGVSLEVAAALLPMVAVEPADGLGPPLDRH